MLSAQRAAAFLILAGLFIATLAGQADAAAAEAVGSGQVDPVLSHTPDEVKLRALTAAHKTASSRASRKLLQMTDADFEALITSMYESIKEGKPLDVKAVMSKFDTLNVSPSPPPPYASRRALMGLRDAA